jgi:hypothetical protein
MLAIGLGLVFGASGRSEAGLVFTRGHSDAAGAINVVIDDRADTVTATIDGRSVPVYHSGTLSLFTVEVTPSFGSFDSASRDLREPHGHSRDRLLVAGAGGFGGITNALLVSFAEDTLGTLRGGTVFHRLTEDGTFQSMFYATATNGGQTAIVNFSVASDVEQVAPEPSTMVMAATGAVFGLVCWLRRSRRTTA